MTGPFIVVTICFLWQTWMLHRSLRERERLSNRCNDLLDANASLLDNWASLGDELVTMRHALEGANACLLDETAENQRLRAELAAWESEAERRVIESQEGAR